MSKGLQSGDEEPGYLDYERLTLCARPTLVILSGAKDPGIGRCTCL